MKLPPLPPFPETSERPATAFSTRFKLAREQADSNSRSRWELIDKVCAISGCTSAQANQEIEAMEKSFRDADPQHARHRNVVAK